MTAPLPVARPSGDFPGRDWSATFNDYGKPAVETVTDGMDRLGDAAIDAERATDDELGTGGFSSDTARSIAYTRCDWRREIAEVVAAELSRDRRRHRAVPDQQRRRAGATNARSGAASCGSKRSAR